MTVYHPRQHTVYTMKDDEELKLKEGGMKITRAEEKSHTQNYFFRLSGSSLFSLFST